MIWCPPVFGGHFMHQSTVLQKVHRNSRLRRYHPVRGGWDNKPERKRGLFGILWLFHLGFWM